MPRIGPEARLPDPSENGPSLLQRLCSVTLPASSFGDDGQLSEVDNPWIIIQMRSRRGSYEGQILSTT